MSEKELGKDSVSDKLNKALTDQLVKEATQEIDVLTPDDIDEVKRKSKLDNDEIQLRIETESDKKRFRDAYSKKAVSLAEIWVISILALVFIQVIVSLAKNETNILPIGVFITLIGSGTVPVLGLFLTILTGLFSSKK